MMGGRHREDDRDFHPRRDDKGFDRMGPRGGEFDRGGPMMHTNLNRMDSDPNKMNMNEQQMVPTNMQPNMMGGKPEGLAAFEKFGINIQSLLQLPPDRFAELTRNMNSQSKEGPFTGTASFVTILFHCKALLSLRLSH